MIYYIVYLAIGLIMAVLGMVKLYAMERKITKDIEDLHGHYDIDDEKECHNAFLEIEEQIRDSLKDH